MKIKVCGMRDPDNIKELSQLPIDLVGLIFYPKSSRYIGDLDPKVLDILPENIERVGVFVNETIDRLRSAIETYNLHYVQLHGDESITYCCDLKQMFPTVKIIKAFSIAEVSDFEKTQGYDKVADLFLFDTKTPQYGGSGQKFDWAILDKHRGGVPFFLSGGILPTDVLVIRKLENNRIVGLDLNSRFEIRPGYKDIELLERFIKEIK